MESTCHEVSWLIIPMNGTIKGAQCWALLLADWALSGDHHKVSNSEWKSMLLSSCITLIAAIVPPSSCAYWAMTGLTGK